MARKIWLLCLLLISSFSPTAWGAACCGGGMALPSIISGDQDAQWNASLSVGEVRQDVGSDSFWREREEGNQTFTISGSKIWADRFQSGISVPIIRRTRASASSTGLGDLSLLFGYELIPDWDYHPLRPKGIIYISGIIPTGTSIQEASAIYQLNARGRGFWSSGLGILLSKNWGDWDAFCNLEMHRAFRRTYIQNAEPLILHPGWGNNTSLGLGYNWQGWRLGLGWTATYEEAIRSSGRVNSKGILQRYQTFQIGLAKLWPHDFSTGIQYFDQTLFGSPLNTTLSRGFAFQVLKQWPR